MKNSPWPRDAASVPEKEMVDPPKGDPVAETWPDMKVEEAKSLNCLAKSTDSEVVLTKVVEAEVDPMLILPMIAKVPAAGFVAAHAPFAAFANCAICVKVIAVASEIPIGLPSLQGWSAVKPQLVPVPSSPQTGT
jgi:hypothetical protein